MLDLSVEIAQLLLNHGRVEDAERVFEIAESFLDEVGDTTYKHPARRLAEIERQLPAAQTPERALRTYQRLSRVMGPEEQADLVEQALDEFSSKAEVCLNVGDPDGAAAWVGRNISRWLHSPDIFRHWVKQCGRWQAMKLRLAKLRGDELDVWGWRGAIFRRFGDEAALGLEVDEDLVCWLAEESLTGAEDELFVEEQHVTRVAGGTGWVVHGLCFEFGDGSRRGTFLEDVDRSEVDLTNDQHLLARSARWVDLARGENIVEVSGHGSLFGFLAFDVALRTDMGRTITFSGNELQQCGALYSFQAPSNRKIVGVKFSGDTCAGVDTGWSMH